MNKKDKEYLKEDIIDLIENIEDSVMEESFSINGCIEEVVAVKDVRRILKGIVKDIRNGYFEELEDEC